MELVCPQCGATSRDDSVDFPSCTHCHELLVKCGYCAHFDVAAGTCRDPRSGRRRVSSDDGVDCSRYRSILASAVALTQRVIGPAKWVLAVAVILFALIVVGTLIQPQSSPATSPAPVRVRASWDPNKVKVGHRFKVDFTVTNVDAGASSGAVRLAIPAAFLDRFKVLSVDPAPSHPRALLGMAPQTSDEIAWTQEGAVTCLVGAPDKRYWHYRDFRSIAPQGRSVITFRLVTARDFVRTGFPFQEGPGIRDPKPKYTYDLTGEKNSDALKGLAVRVYNYRADQKGIFEAPEVFKVKVEN